MMQKGRLSKNLKVKTLTDEMGVGGDGSSGVKPKLNFSYFHNILKYYGQSCNWKVRSPQHTQVIVYCDETGTFT